MPRKKNAGHTTGDEQSLARFLDGTDYRVSSDDLVLYQLSSFVEDDQASFENDDFRKLIDAGIRQHVEERADVRAELAARLRRARPAMSESAQAAATRVVEALEDIEKPLKNAASVVRSYTAYLFNRLQEIAGEDTEAATTAGEAIERYRRGQVDTSELVAQLTAIGIPAVGPTADLLFGTVEDGSPDAASMEAAVTALSHIRSSSSSRVLAHAIAEPMLSEDLEQKAADAVRSFWPLPRPYILSELQSHTHEDLPFRWFQIFIEASEIYAVDLILEEFIVHGNQETFVADLTALSELLRQSRDPETEAMILNVLNETEKLLSVSRM
jgi:hypothetical protein